MSVVEMAKPGIWMNLIAITIQLAFITTLGRIVYDLDRFPDWAASASNATAGIH